MRYSMFNLWLAKVWFAFMDESQQNSNYHEIASLAAIQQPALIVFVGDHRQILEDYRRVERQQLTGKNCPKGHLAYALWIK